MALFLPKLPGPSQARGEGAATPAGESSEVWGVRLGVKGTCLSEPGLDALTGLICAGSPLADNFGRIGVALNARSYGTLRMGLPCNPVRCLPSGAAAAEKARNPLVGIAGGFLQA